MTPTSNPSIKPGIPNLNDVPRIDFLEGSEFLEVDPLQDKQRAHGVRRKPPAAAPIIHYQPVEEKLTLGRAPQRHETLMKPRKVLLQNCNGFVEPLLVGKLGLFPVDNCEFVDDLAQFSADLGAIHAFPAILDFIVHEFDTHGVPSDRNYFEPHG